MSFARYPAYKDSGVEWLGEVPGHWEVKRLKYNLQLLTEKTNRREHAIALENIESWTGRYLPTETEFEGDGVAFEAGDILFGKLRPYLAKAYLAESSGEAVGDFHVLRPTANADGRFAQYQILNREFIDLVDGSTFGSKMPRASWEFVAGIALATPPKAEQQAIATFLDTETAKIDGLMAEQRALVVLLKEKRQAVISHAVTKGLNPAAPMKDSGVAWLGEVPGHWAVSPMRWFSACSSGNGLATHEVEIESDLCKIPTIGRNGVMGFTSKSNIHHSALAIGRVGALCGNVHIVHPPAWITDNALILDATASHFLLQYLADVLISRNLNEIASKTAQPLITGTQVRDQRVPRPPMIEQQEIISFVTYQTTQLDTLTQEAQTAIALLQERRTALISAAVTGKVDVRAAMAA